MIAPINQRHVNSRALQPLGEIEPGKSATHDHHTRRFRHLELHGGATPAGEANHVDGRWYRLFVAIRRVHPPAEICRVGDGEKRRLAPPVAAAKHPRGLEQVEGESRRHHRSQEEARGEDCPGALVSRIEIGWHGWNVRQSPRAKRGGSGPATTVAQPGGHRRCDFGDPSLRSG